MRLYLTTLYVNNDKRHCFAYSYVQVPYFYTTAIVLNTQEKERERARKENHSFAYDIYINVGE